MKLTLKRGIAFLLVVVITSNTYIPVYAQEEQEVQEIDLAKEKTAGLQKVDGKYYYFGEDGTALTGWIEIDGNMYYFAPDSGQAYTNTTEVINDVEYVFSSEGIATEKTSDEILTDENLGEENQEEFTQDDPSSSTDETFSQNPDSTSATEQENVGDGLVGGSEDLENEETTDEFHGKELEISEEQDKTEESILSGWDDSSGKLRYYSTSGEYLTGKCEVGGNWYYFDDDGVCLKNQWITDGEKKYYAMSNGVLRVGWLSFGNTYYYCGNDASIIQGIEYPVNGVMYSFDRDGVMEIEGGWGSYNGKLYYKNPATGFPYIGWVTFGSTHYYADGDGFMVTGWQNIRGKFYYFYEDTYVMARNTVIDGYQIDSEGVSVAKGIRDKIEEIKKYEGYPYVTGGNTPDGWDCSGCIQWIYQNIFGISLPRTTYEQVLQGSAVSIYDMSLWQPGDLIFFSSGSISHVGLYLGDNLMLHALGTQYGTRIDDVQWYDNWDSVVWLAAVRRVL